MGFVQTNDDVSLLYRDWGEGEPVVFCAAWALSSVAWQYQMISVLDSRRRAVAYDRRGHGRSDDPGSGYDHDTLADDLASLVDHLDLHDVTLVAHSMGSGDAVRYLTRHGSDRVARLVLLAPTTPFLLKTPDNHNGVDAELFAARWKEWRCDFGRWIVENEGPYFGEGLPGCESPLCCATGPSTTCSPPACRRRSSSNAQPSRPTSARNSRRSECPRS
ncbi:MAG: alpha/beta hydrolase [Solirubrobacterales bacterium]|nr:alpha/beta hydrolase [Solirubrobacterales bacterium]